MDVNSSNIQHNSEGKSSDKESLMKGNAIRSNNSRKMLGRIFYKSMASMLPIDEVIW